MTQVQSASGLKPARSVTAGAYTCSFRHRWGLYLLVPSNIGRILTVPAGIGIAPGGYGLQGPVLTSSVRFTAALIAVASCGAVIA